MKRLWMASGYLVAGLFGAGLACGAQPTALEILQKGVSFRTLPGSGQVPAYAEYLRSVLVEAGFAPGDVRVEAFGEGDAATATLTARYAGRDAARQPILLIGHMDVVDARREDWTRDPFTAVVEQGYVFGRGVLDNKFDVTAQVAALARLKRAGWKPGRDVLLALSGDEETSGNSAAHLVTQLKNAEFALNGDAGGGELAEDGASALGYGIQAGEKTYSDFTLTVTDAGGHSSRPTPGNAIYRLSRALDKVAALRFPVEKSELTRSFFRATAPKIDGEAGDAMRRYVANPDDQQAIEILSRYPEHNAQLRTTCVATLIGGGHAPNALPQRATANVNCRIFPGVPAASVKQLLVGAIADPGVSIEYDAALTRESPASPLRPELIKAVEKAVHARYPGLAVVPSMSTGATDGVFYRAAGIPTYGVSGVFMRSADDFAHGLNERVPVAAIEPAVTHWESLLRDLAR
ncbi:MAG: M20/M25/M40 family metallo-hydrolase [Steroidobacteraceae bacterium]